MIDKASLLSQLEKNIPTELKSHRFINYSLVNKKPLAPPDFQNLYKGFNYSNHSFSECLDNAIVNKDLGVALLTGNKLGCVDFDNCVWYDARRDFAYVDPKAKYLIRKLGGYSEISLGILNPDGVGGMHVIGEANFSQYRKIYRDLGWHDSRVDLKYSGGYVGLTGFMIESDYGRLDVNQDWLEIDSSKPNPDLMIQLQGYQVEVKHIVDIENRLSRQKKNGSKYEAFIAGVHEKFARYRESAISDLAQAVCYYSYSDSYWDKRGVEASDKRLQTLKCADRVLARSGLGWNVTGDISKARVLENAISHFESGTNTYGQITPEYSDRQRKASLISQASNNQVVKADSDSHIRQAIDEIGLAKKSAVAKLAGVSRPTLYRYLRDNHC